MVNSRNRVIALSAVGISGGISAIITIALVGDTFGFPGTVEYRVYETFNRAMGFFIALQTCALLGFHFQNSRALRKVGRAALYLAIIAWIGMALGTAAEFWLYSHLPYGEANIRSTAFSVFSISSLLGGLALLALGIDLFLSQVLPRYFSVILMLYLVIDFGLWIWGQSIFLAPALAALAFGDMALRCLRGSRVLPLEKA